MPNDETSGKEGDESNDQKRTQWESANYRMVVCENGVVNVQNQNYNERGHVYSVRVEDGAAVGCSCPHAVHRDAHCKHQRAVESRPIVVSSATWAGSTHTPRVATDGGEDRGVTEVHSCVTCSNGFALGGDDQCAECQAKGRKPVDDTPL